MGVMQTLAEMLLGLRSERSLSQDALARAAGVSRGTIQNAEAHGKVNASTVMLLLQALNEKIPLTKSQLVGFKRVTAISERMLLSLYRATDPDVDRAVEADSEMHALLDDLLSRADREFVRGALATLLANLRSRPDDTTRSVTVRHPPVQRPGYVEEVITDYTAPKAQTTPRAKRRDGAG